jgi:protein SCO1
MNRSAMMKLFIAPIAFALMLAACDGSNVAPAAIETPPLAGATIGGPFTLSDKFGKPVKWTDFAGKYRIVYFGFTFCPDVCPTDVAALMQGFSQFAKTHPARAADIQPIFISIDPGRDTPEKVGEFAAAFSPRLLGLTGTAAQVDGAAKAFKVYYAKGAQSAGGYLMDHSRIAYLMDRDGKPLSMLPVDKGPDAVAADLAKWVK